jgi:hypothetical protein
MAERLARYGAARSDAERPSVEGETDDLRERAVTLLKLMPRNQRRETVENLLSPNDSQRAREAVDALIEAALVEEDHEGRIRRIA